VHELTLDRSAATPAKVHITDSTGKFVSPKLVFPAFNEHIEKDGNNLGAKSESVKVFGGLLKQLLTMSQSDTATESLAKSDLPFSPSSCTCCFCR
jgi:hypothetical protein